MHVDTVVEVVFKFIHVEVLILILYNLLLLGPAPFLFGFIIRGFYCLLIPSDWSDRRLVVVGLQIEGVLKSLAVSYLILLVTTLIRPLEHVV